MVWKDFQSVRSVIKKKYSDHFELNVISNNKVNPYPGDPLLTKQSLLKFQRIKCLSSETVRRILKMTIYEVVYRKHGDGIFCDQNFRSNPNILHASRKRNELLEFRDVILKKKLFCHVMPVATTFSTSVAYL